MFLAGLVRMAGMAAAARRYGFEAFPVAAVADVVDERPGAVEGRRAKIVLVPAYRIAGRVTDPAIDAFDRGRGCKPRLALRRDRLDVIAARLGRDEGASGIPPFLEKAAHIGGEVFDHGRVFQRGDLEPAVSSHPGHVGAARPARPAVDGHGARAAYADPAGEPIGQRGIEVALHKEDRK